MITPAGFLWNRNSRPPIRAAQANPSKFILAVLLGLLRAITSKEKPYRYLSINILNKDQFTGSSGREWAHGSPYLQTKCFRGLEHDLRACGLFLKKTVKTRIFIRLYARKRKMRPQARNFAESRALDGRILRAL